MLRITNSGANTWPEGQALVVKDGVPMARITLPFVGPTSSADLTIADVAEIPHAVEVREVEREPRSAPYRFVVTHEAEVTLRNTRDEPMTLELTFEVEGAVTDTGGASVRRLLQESATRSNPYSALDWRVTLAPGEEREFRFRYQTYVIA